MPTVLAYHGCNLDTAHDLLGGSPFKHSTRDYDWLGKGSYFWENDALRAYQWAAEPRREFDHPSVVGAVIELGNCLDLTTQTGIAAIRLAYDEFMSMARKNGTPVPENVDPSKVGHGDKVLRRLDCAVVNYLFEILRTAQESDPYIQPHPTVRALFPEGTKLYPGAGFWQKTHVQICVREPEQILGVFRIPEWQRVELNLPELY
ncbi:MAG: hypothetical protein WAM85_08240 [Terracidiphilus sp.]